MNLIFIAPHLDQQHHNQLMSSADVIAVANSITMVTTSCQDAEMPGVRYHEVGFFSFCFFLSCLVILLHMMSCFLSLTL